jgi:hypothetical protein
MPRGADTVSLSVTFRKYLRSESETFKKQNLYKARGNGVKGFFWTIWMVFLLAYYFCVSTPHLRWYLHWIPKDSKFLSWYVSFLGKGLVAWGEGSEEDLKSFVSSQANHYAKAQNKNRKK